MAQASVLLLCQYTTTLSKGKEPGLLLQGGSLQNIPEILPGIDFLSKNLCEILQVALFPTTIYMLRSIYSFCKIKSDCIKNLSFTDYASRIWQHDFIVKCFEIDLFLLLHLMTGPSSMSISSLVIKL